MGDKLARVFAKQILDTTMDFLYGLLLDGLGLAESITESAEKEDLQRATGIGAEMVPYLLFSFKMEFFTL